MNSKSEYRRSPRRAARQHSAAVALSVAVGLLSLLFTPTSTSETGHDLVFAFDSNPSSIEAFDTSGEAVHGMELSPRGLARLDCAGALLTERGHFIAEHAGPLWAPVLSSAQGFTIEIVAAPARTPLEQTAPLIRVEATGAKPAFLVTQAGAELVAILGPEESGTAARISLGSIVAGVEFHAAVVFDGHQLRGYLNGSPAEARTVSAIAEVPAGAEVIIAGASEGRAEWAGSIARVALYRRPMEPGLIAARSEAALEKAATRAPVARLVVDAVLIGKSPVPTLAELAPYTQSLAVYEYEVENVQAGDYEQRKIYVVHWTILDNTRLPFADISPGGKYRLLLERFEDQPQLQSENLSDSIVEDFSVPWFYDAVGTSLGFDAAAEITAVMSKGMPTTPVSPARTAQAPELRTPLTQDMRDARARDVHAVETQLAAQVARAGGYPAWTAALGPFREAVRLNAGSHDRYTIVGLEKHLFSRGGTDYLLDTDLVQMPAAPAPDRASPSRALDAIVEFNRQLQSRGVDLIYVPVPAREEVYPDKLSAASPIHPLVTPQLTQFMEALTEAGVEVVDLREAFLDEREKHEELLYPISDVHWGTYGVRRAAAEIAPRLRRYKFEGSMPPVEYSEKIIRLTNQGNLVTSLPEAARADYPPFEQDVVQVLNPDGTPYRSVENSPVLVMGDSFTMSFEKQSGSLSAHLAKELQAPVSNLPSKGGGPKVPRLLAEKGAAFLAPRRVLVWVMVSRYLSDGYAREWESPPPLE